MNSCLYIHFGLVLDEVYSKVICISLRIYINYYELSPRKICTLEVLD